MKDIYEVLRQKELEKSRLENEVEALRVAASLPAGRWGSRRFQPADIVQFDLYRSSSRIRRR